MPLYDVTHKDVLVKPSDASNYDLLVKAREMIGTLRFNKDIQIFDSAIDKVVSQATDKNKLIFTKAGFIVGHQSTVLVVKDQRHVWDSADLAFPCHLDGNRIDEHAAETQLKFVGGMMRWRISLRDETWLVYRRPSGTYNKLTGKEITVSEYWVCENYERPAKKCGFSTHELTKRFNDSRIERRA